MLLFEILKKKEKILTYSDFVWKMGWNLKISSKITPSLTVGHRTLGPENFLWMEKTEKFYDNGKSLQTKCV